MKEIRFTINGNLPTLNEYTKACRSNKFAGSTMKKDAESLIAWYVKAQVTDAIKGEFDLEVDWYEKDSKKDFDNVVFAQKMILDTLTACKVIENDSRKYFTQMQHRIHVDKDNPRIEVCIRSPQAQGDV